MRTTSLSGKTHSVYISVCLNGSATFKHPYFLAKGAVQSNIEKPPLTTTTMQRYGEFFRFANKS